MHPAGVAHVADDRRYGCPLLRGREFLLDAVKGVFVHIEQDQAGRLESCDLAGEFRTDRAAGPCDQYDLAPEQLMQTGAIENHLVAPEQVFELDGADLGDGDVAREQVVIGRDGKHRQTRGTG